MKGPGKGHTNNPKGRPAGTPNRITSDLRQSIKTILENEVKELPQLLKRMEPEKRADILSRLLQYVVPRMQNVGPKTEFEMLSNEQLDQVINELKKQENGNERRKN